MERLSKGCAGGRSFFGVRARGEGSKGYAEKGTPTKFEILEKFGSGRQGLKSDSACNYPMNGLMTWLAAAFVFAQPATLLFPLISQLLLSTHFEAFRRRNLRKLPQFYATGTETLSNFHVLKRSRKHLVAHCLLFFR